MTGELAKMQASHSQKYSQSCTTAAVQRICLECFRHKIICTISNLDKVGARIAKMNLVVARLFGEGSRSTQMIQRWLETYRSVDAAMTAMQQAEGDGGTESKSHVEYMKRRELKELKELAEKLKCFTAENLAQAMGLRFTVEEVYDAFRRLGDNCLEASQPFKLTTQQIAESHALTMAFPTVQHLTISSSNDFQEELAALGDGDSEGLHAGTLTDVVALKAENRKLRNRASEAEETLREFKSANQGLESRIAVLQAQVEVKVEVVPVPDVDEVQEDGETEALFPSHITPLAAGASSTVAQTHVRAPAHDRTLEFESNDYLRLHMEETRRKEVEKQLEEKKDEAEQQKLAFEKLRQEVRRLQEHNRDLEEKVAKQALLMNEDAMAARTSSIDSDDKRMSSRHSSRNSHRTRTRSEMKKETKETLSGTPRSERSERSEALDTPSASPVNIAVQDSPKSTFGQGEVAGHASDIFAHLRGS
eukprot:TRINITY_DN28989_c0_g1_i1.p1 TRINITY_DN28989_c0_g1~~TRINITY_DN28989_c0_g1_i1.p1  ORF type:complete len:510 (-),score=102.93 TRINITY_DN28989_c0_g1_i1:116-1546(-)